MANVRTIIADPGVIREAIHKKVTEAIKAKFPIVSNNYKAVLKDISIRQTELTSQEEAETKMRKGNAPDGVFVNIDIEDKNGKVVATLDNHRLMNLPYYTNRYTLMLDGNEYNIVSQMRTKSGVYTRKRGNDELESAFNLAKGANFKLIMDPDTGTFKVDMLGSTMPAMAVLRILGAGPSDIQGAIGDELYNKNDNVSVAQMERTRNTLYDKLVQYKSDGSGKTATAEEKNAAIRNYFSNTQIDPETTKLTLGKSFSSVSALTILEAMKKLLAVYKGTDDIDERDNLEFQKIFTIEDLFKEVIDKSPDIVQHIKRKLDAFKPGADKAENRKALRNAFSPVYFTKPIHNFITGSTLSRIPSQINPVEFMDSASIITRLGEGGISSETAVPFETRGVNNSYLGVIDPIAAPESFKVGIDAHCTIGARKGDDNEFYKQVVDCKTGRRVNMRVIELYDKHVGFPDPKYVKEKKPDDVIASVYKGRIEKVKRSQLDYQIPSPHDMSTYTTNTIPFMNANQGNRLLMGDKHIQQSLPLLEPEKRLVTSVLDNGSVEDVIGNWTLPKSPVDGTVERVEKNCIVVRGTDGHVVNVDYDRNFPLATKTFLDCTPTVKAGQKVTKGQVLAESNFTKDGTLAMGRNLSVAYMPYMGLNHEDGVVVSESTAKKLTSVHADKFEVQLNDDVVCNKKKYAVMFPTTFTAEQLKELDDDGVVQEGAILHPGDPVILAMKSAGDSRQNQVLGLLHKSLIHPYNDISEVYEEQFDGEVTGVQKTSQQILVVVKVAKTLQVGDKLAGSYGNKGVCSKILPDDQMPQDADGKPLDVVLTSMSVISRINPAQTLESTLGKIAKKKGITYEVENFSQPDFVEYVRKEMQKHHVSDKETVTDPITGKKIPGVFVGVQHFHKLFKTSDSNFAGRGIDGPHDQDEAPTGSGFGGPKALGGMEVNALIAHNARAVLRESTMLRGSKNADFWKAFQMGMNPNFPNEKKTFTRFVATLKQAGINVTREGDELVAAPLTDKDVLAMSSGPITWESDGASSRGMLLRAKDYSPEPGGLFDTMTTGGLKGTKWSHIQLAEPLVNPVFSDAAKTLLGMSTKELDKACVEKGGAFIKNELNKIDVASELKKTEDEMNSGKMTKGALNTAVKKVGFLRALNDLKLKPGDAYVLSMVPVTPPIMRPISIGQSGDSIENDANKLYSSVVLLNNAFKRAKGAGLSDESLQENRRALMDSFGALTGVLAPSEAKLKARGVKGALDFIAGDVPKQGYFQRKVIYGKMNLTGRSTITPDTTLGLDEVGLPEKIAWEMYKPFITRKLAQMGYNPLQARDEVEKRSPMAKKILEEEMSQRPVIINRAPTLWRHGIMAAKPLLRSDTNLHVNSLWESSLNADYDGDAMQIHLPVTDEAVKDAYNIMPSKQLFSDKKKDDLLQVFGREPVSGLYVATANVGKTVIGSVKKYPNVDAAWKDYYAGKLKITDLVDIAG